MNSKLVSTSQAGRSFERPRWWPSTAIVLATIASAVVAGAVKLNALAAWRYTSDLFTWDQMLQETLGGRFGLEYTYGNQFGDHAYLFLLALLPVKAAAGPQMVHVLLFAGPAVFALAVLTFFITSDATSALMAAVASAALLFHVGFGAGLVEVTYGCHPDVVGGFAAVAMAAALDARRERSRTIWKGAGMAFVLAAIVFLSVKEEMALLGVLFFGVLALDRRDRAWRASAMRWLVASAVVFAGDLLLIRICETPWNRRDATLMRGLVDRSRAGEIAMLLRSPEARPYLVFALGSLVGFALACLLANRIRPVALALASIGVAKLAFSLAVSDFELSSWHNYPGVVMLTGAVLLQLRAAATSGAAWRRILAGMFVYALLIFEVHRAAAVDWPWLWRIWQEDSVRRSTVATWRSEISTLQQRIERSRVVSIDPETAAAWTGGFRIAFFPRGVSASPVGIADYAVLPQDVAAASELAEFEPLRSTRHFVLFRRAALGPASRVWRRRFVSRFGAGAIGGPP